MNMYDQSPQFGFTQSSLPGLPTTLDNINPMYYNQLFGFLSGKYGSPANARLASINGLVLYDTLRFDAGVLPAREFTFFQTPIGQQQGLFVSGTQYTKQDIDVHQWIVQGGQLAVGYEALIWEIGVQVHVLTSEDASLQVGGNFINLTLDPGDLTGQTDASLNRSDNVMRAFQEGTYFELFVNQTNFELGPAWRFPSGFYGISGEQAVSTTQTATSRALGHVNNGFGICYQMPVMRHLPSLTRFGVRMKVQNPFTLANVGPTRVVVTLGGIGVQPITG